MDTNRIKRFATEARNILKAGIAAKIITLGFDKKGQVAEANRPQLMQGGSLWNGQLHTEGFYHQWMSLYNRIQQKGINEVYEEAAYTWFNRLCAIRILQKNQLCAPVLDYADAARTPFIVDEARQGRIPQMKEDARTRLMELLDDDTKVTEQFAVLITAWCHDNPIIYQCFGSMSDYTELLLPNNILAEGGFVDMLNHTEFITDEDFQSPELIGWLYQFYISERKDEVFAKKGKFEADDIPAATQIFTPNWIVKYMVQNTVGRIYLDNNPYERQLQKKWLYLVKPSEKTPAESILKYNELTDLKVADLACGSGHILNECFDLLYELYIAEGYGRKEAIEDIFKYNLTGVDIDLRAKQLATFALLLKACQKDASFADAHCLPHVLTMPKPWNEEKNGLVREFLPHFFLGQENQTHVDELIACFDLMQEADSLGSIMKFKLSDSTRLLIKQTVEYWHNQDFVPEAISTQLPAFELILTLTEKYHVLVMNPPYMGSGNMNATLSKYVKKEYPIGKSDLFSAFMILAIDRLVINGKYGMINMHSWMFLSSFEALRHEIINHQMIDSLLHLGPRTFDELSGEVVQNAAFVITKAQGASTGIYFRLVDGKNCGEKERMYLQALAEHTDKVYYPNIDQDSFKKIPSFPIGYWVNKNIIKCFNNNSIKDYTISDGQNITANNNKYLRMHWEVNKYTVSNYAKWKPYAKGGIFRKWYGNMEYVIDWSNKARAFYHKNSSARIIPQYLWNKRGITWTLLSSNQTGFRLLPLGATFDKTGSSIFCKHDEDITYIMSLLNSKLSSFFLKIFSSTMAFQIVEIQRIPLIKYYINNSLPKQNIFISKQDWDAHETSWDFQRNELLNMDAEVQKENINNEVEKHFKETGEHICIDVAEPHSDSIEWCMEQYKKKWEHMFNQLHENEEELNRLFIEIYGLQDELTPDVPIDEITILQQGEISFVPSSEDNQSSKMMVWNDDIIIKQFISYAVGCMMGRYRLDKPGLHIAHPEPTAEEIAPYTYKGMEFAIDDDGIMPLMNGDCGFSDNAPLRMADFVRIAFGEDAQVENLNYIEKCLGKPLEQFFVKDFWKDHKKMYQNRPIYWLFASKKGAFQVIAYMHRMNAYTVERIRAKYLLPYIEHLEGEINKLDMRRAELTTKESKQLQTLQKQLDECREYHERLQVVAEQAIKFDLDDGVVVNYAKFGNVLQKIK